MAVAGLAGMAACGRTTTKPMDPSLQQDLAATSSSAMQSQMVISPEEEGDQSAPKPAEHKVVPKPTPKPARRLASNQQQPVQATLPGPEMTAPAPTQPAPVAAPAPQPAAEPAPLPPAARPNPGRQPGVYKTEGQVFQQMPWIRP